MRRSVTTYKVKSWKYYISIVLGISILSVVFYPSAVHSAEYLDDPVLGLTEAHLLSETSDDLIMAYSETSETPTRIEFYVRTGAIDKTSPQYRQVLISGDYLKLEIDSGIEDYTSPTLSDKYYLSEKMGVDCVVKWVYIYPARAAMPGYVIVARNPFRVPPGVAPDFPQDPTVLDKLVFRGDQSGSVSLVPVASVQLNSYLCGTDELAKAVNEFEVSMQDYR